MMVAARTAGLVVAMLGLVGCLYEPAYPQLSCTIDGDCSAGSVCRAGFCVAEEAAEPDMSPDMVEPDDSVPIVITRVEVTPASSDLTLGNRLLLAASVFDADGNEVLDATVVWSSADPAIASVDASGAVEAVAPGTVQISAAVDDVVGSATVNVLAPVDTVVVDPATAALGQGLSLALTATALDGAGSELVGRDVAWTSSDETIVEVDTEGVVTALAVGSATITATVEGVAGSSALTVEANPVVSVIIEPDEPTLTLNQIKTFEAVIRDANDTVLDPRNRAFSWRLSNMATGSLIDFNVPSQRRVHGLQVGSVTLSVDVDSAAATDELEIEVVLPVVDSVVITPEDIVPIGSTRQLETTVSDPDGNVLTGRTHQWSTSAPAVATVSPTGLLTALTPGNTMITVDVDGVMATLDVEVAFLLTQVSAGRSHSCGASPDGVAFCWGDGADGRLGNGGTTDSPQPVQVSGSFAFDEVWAGGTFSCGLEVSGGVFCWGASGQTGVADGSSSSIPRAIDGGRFYTDLSVSDEHACAIDTAGKVWCWGHGADGRLGNNDTVDVNGAVQVSFSPPGTPTSLALGVAHSCVLTDATTIWCWGNGAEGALGNNDTQSSSVPAVVMSAIAFVEISAGGQFTCGRTSGNAVYCWGSNSTGQLGLGDLATAMSAVPASLPGVALSGLGLGTNHGCGLDAVGSEVVCWGQPDDFRLGNMDATTVIAAPVANAANLLASAVDGGAAHTCAVAMDGRPYCWGSNASGRSGTAAGATLGQPNLVWP